MRRTWPPPSSLHYISLSSSLYILLSMDGAACGTGGPRGCRQSWGAVGRARTAYRKLAKEHPLPAGTRRLWGGRGGSWRGTSGPPPALTPAYMRYSSSSNFFTSRLIYRHLLLLDHSPFLTSSSVFELLLGLGDVDKPPSLRRVYIIYNGKRGAQRHVSSFLDPIKPTSQSLDILGSSRANSRRTPLV